MANVALVTTQRIIKNQTIDCTYIGTIQNDGWIYFNDDVWWRAKVENNWFDFASLQRFYIDKQIWMPTNMAIVKSIKKFNVSQAQNMINGGGSIAPNADVEAAVLWAIEKARSGLVGYSNDIRNLGNPDGYLYDCSSFVITAFIVGGFNLSCTYTGDMKSDFLSEGFTWYPGTTWTSEELIRGDILLQEQYHTELYIGDGQDANCGGEVAQIIPHWDYYTNPEIGYYGGWDGILRYEA